MTTEVIQIIDIDYLKNYCVNEELYDLCTEDSSAVNRYINIVSNKIKMYLDIEQFKDWEDHYIFPEDLKDAARFLVESLYLNRNNTTTEKSTGYTEKHDDYSISQSYDSSYKTQYWYWIPVIDQYLAILDKYRGESYIARSWYFKILDNE